MNSSDFEPKAAGDVVPDPFVEGTTNRWMPFDPIKAAMGYHAARALAYSLQTELEPDNTSAVALMVTEYHIASLYYAQVTGGMTSKGCIGFNKGMRERPYATLHNIIHMLTFLGIDHREIKAFRSPERVQREALEKLALDLIHHSNHEGEAVEVRGPRGWYDVLDVIQGAIHPDAHKADPTLLPGIRAKLTHLKEQDTTE